MVMVVASGMALVELNGDRERLSELVALAKVKGWSEQLVKGTMVRSNSLKF